MQHRKKNDERLTHIDSQHHVDGGHRRRRQGPQTGMDQASDTAMLSPQVAGGVLRTIPCLPQVPLLPC